MVIDKDVAEVVKNFLENYAEVHGLPSPGRSVNRITQSIIFLPTEMSYKSVHRDFLAGLEEDSSFRTLKYDAFRKLWPQLTPQLPNIFNNYIRPFVKDTFKDVTCL